MLEFFNYHLIQRTETGVINKLRRDAERGEAEGDRAMLALDNVVVLGYENVAFPFLALLSGLAVGFIQLGVETINICKTNIVMKLKKRPGETDLQIKPVQHHK